MESTIGATMFERWVVIRSGGGSRREASKQADCRCLSSNRMAVTDDRDSPWDTCYGCKSVLISLQSRPLSQQRGDLATWILPHLILTFSPQPQRKCLLLVKTKKGLYLERNHIKDPKKEWAKKQTWAADIDIEITDGSLDSPNFALDRGRHRKWRTIRFCRENNRRENRVSSGAIRET